MICSEEDGGVGWQGLGWWRGGVGRLFSNYAVWNNHAGDISKSDLLSRRCGAQRNVVGPAEKQQQQFLLAVLVTDAPAAAATDNEG